MKKIQKKLWELTQKKLAVGVTVLVLNQIQGYLPTLTDYISPKVLCLITFGLAIVLSAIKGMEMFYEKAEQLVKTGEIIFDTEEIVNPNIPKKP